MQVADLLRIPRTYRSLARVREILGVVVKYGWGDLVARLDLENAVDLARRRLSRRGPDDAVRRYTTEQRIRLALEELGPTFVKLGQILSTRPDLVPMSLVRELRRLQDDVTPFSSREVRREIEAEAGRAVADVFPRFDDRPLAAASMAQVHRATLASGEEVAVKVRRPGLPELIERDLDIMRGLAALIEENLAEARSYAPRAIVEEFARAIRREVDFTYEARHLLRFAANFEGDPNVRVPAVHRDLSGPGVLVMEYVDGIKASDAAALDTAGIDRVRLARLGVDFVLKQIFEHGFFHGDPHPGNVLVLPGPVIAPLDFGMMGRVDRERVDSLLELLVGVLLQDEARIAKLFFEQGLVEEDVDEGALRRDVRELLDDYHSVPLGEVDVSTLLLQLFEVFARHRIRVPPDLLLMGKALATVEGMARELDPKLDPLQAMRPYLLRLYLERLADPRFLARDAISAAEHTLDLVASAPRDVRRILTDLRRGALTVRVRLDELDRYGLEQARNANRTSLALLVASGLVASALLFGQQSGPVLLGLHLSTLLALAGFGVAGAGLSILAIGYLRSGRF